MLFQLHRIDRIRRHLTVDSAKILVDALVLSRLDYCNSLFVGLLKKVIHYLQVIQNATARLIFHKKASDDATVLLKKLHWLPISQRIAYKLIVLPYRCLHVNPPPPFPHPLTCLVTLFHMCLVVLCGLITLVALLSPPPNLSLSTMVCELFLRPHLDCAMIFQHWSVFLLTFPCLKVYWRPTCMPLLISDYFISNCVVSKERHLIFHYGKCAI